MALSAGERDGIRELARAINSRNRRKREREGEEQRERLALARAEVDRLVTEFQRVDPALRRVVLFGSLARDDAKSLDFDIDLAVDASRYLDLLGIALDSPFKVDLVDLSSASRYIVAAIERDGVEVYRAG